MLVGSSWNLVGQAGWVPWIKPWSNHAWLGFWHFTAIGLPILITVITGFGFTWGGIRDIRALFRSLKAGRIDDADNGTVHAHKPYCPGFSPVPSTPTSNHSKSAEARWPATSWQPIPIIAPVKCRPLP